MNRMIYIAGPMSGYPALNYAAFRAAAASLSAAGCMPVSPCDVGLNLDRGKDTFPASVYLRADIAALMGCWGICLLPGWEKSVGAVTEATVARALSLHCITQEGEETEWPLLPALTHGYHDGDLFRG